MESLFPIYLCVPSLKVIVMEKSLDKKNFF